MQAKLTSDVMSPNDYPDAMPSTPVHLTEEFVARLEKHQRILFKVAYMYCRDRDDRQDLVQVQEMLIEVWRSYARFDERVQFSTWMYRIAVNVANTHYCRGRFWESWRGLGRSRSGGKRGQHREFLPGLFNVPKVSRETRPRVLGQTLKLAELSGQKRLGRRVEWSYRCKGTSKNPRSC